MALGSVHTGRSPPGSRPIPSRRMADPRRARVFFRSVLAPGVRRARAADRALGPRSRRQLRQRAGQGLQLLLLLHRAVEHRGRGHHGDARTPNRADLHRLSACSGSWASSRSAITGVVFHVVLRNLRELTGWDAVADFILHTASPVVTVAGFLLVGPRVACLSSRIVRLAVIAPPRLARVHARARPVRAGRARARATMTLPVPRRAATRLRVGVAQRARGHGAVRRGVRGRASRPTGSCRACGSSHAPEPAAGMPSASRR